MRMRFSAITVCLVATSSAALAQSVAVIGKTAGTVLVNRGNGFVGLSRGTPLATGDVVYVRRGGQAVVEYMNGCSRALKPGRAITVYEGDCTCEASAAAGSILGDRSGGFVKAVTDTALVPGDIASSKRHGQVVLEYANGCHQTVQSVPTGADVRVDCVCKERPAAKASLVGVPVIASAGFRAAIGSNLTQQNGAPGGGYSRFYPVSR